MFLFLMFLLFLVYFIVGNVAFLIEVRNRWGRTRPQREEAERFERSLAQYWLFCFVWPLTIVWFAVEEGHYRFTLHRKSRGY